MINRLKLTATAIFCLLVCGGSASPSSDSFEYSQLIELNEDNWQSMLKGEWMVEFFAPWCPACKNLSPTWERFAVMAGRHQVHVAKIDVTLSPSLSGRFFVTALPTIYHVKDGVFRQYRSSRDGDALLLFVKDKQWKKIDPISSWKQPDSIQMSVLSYFFKLSHVLKDFNSRLHEEYGLPTWGSYALFAVGTIFVGAVLGLLLICIVDFLYPPKRSQRQSFSESKAFGDSVEDIPNDEIEDDAEEEADNNEEDEASSGDQDGENNSTSEGEKNSGSESEPEESEENEDDAEKIVEAQEPKKSSPEPVRKRKPRKAD